MLVGSTGRVNFWISDSIDGDTFSFPTSIWAVRPAVRELEPEFGSRRETGNPAIDIGSDAGLSFFINTGVNENPPNSATYTPGLNTREWWLELTTVVEGTNAGTTDEIVRIAIEDDFNAGVDLGDYPNNMPNGVELTRFNSVTHAVGDNFSFPTGGSISSQSTSNEWSSTQGEGSGDSSDVGLQLTNDTDSVIDFTNGRIDVSITVTRLPTGTDSETSPTLAVLMSSGAIFTIITGGDPITQVGEYIFSDRTASPANAMIQPGESLQIYLSEGTPSHQGFEYRVNYVRLSTTQLEYKPAGDYPNITDSIAAVQFGQETFPVTLPTGEAGSFAADGQLDGPIGGWRFHPLAPDRLTILFERESGGDVNFNNGRIDVSIDIISLPPGFNSFTDRITIGMDVVNTSDGLPIWNDEISGVHTTGDHFFEANTIVSGCLLYTSPSPRDRQKSRMPSSA